MRNLLSTLLEQLQGAWRFRWIALIAAWSVCLLGWLIVLLLPDTYQASARVFVDTRTTLSEVTQGIAVETNMDTQIQRVRQALLGGPILEKVAKDTGLVTDADTPQHRQSTVSQLQERIQIVGTVSRDAPTSSTYVISYNDGSRARSLRVVDQLLTTFVDNTLGGKREGSEQAQQFLVNQIADYEKRLSSAESRLADFKKENFGLMPGAQGDYFTRLQTEVDGASKAEAALGIALGRRAELQRQLRSSQPLLTGAAPASAASGTAGGAAGTGGNDTASRIRETQTRLDEALLRFTDRHPDVLALRETLKDLQTRQQEEIEAFRRGDPGAAGRVGLSSNPVYQSIQLQLNQTEVEVASLRGEIAERRRKAAGLQELVGTAPEVEAEFARLNRDYDVTRAQYQSLVERLERARISENADAKGIVRFEVIDPPSAAFSPIAPNRPRLILMVLLAGLGIGGGLAYILHQLKPVFSNSRQLNEVTGLPVLGVVSMTWLDRNKSQEVGGVIAYVGAAFLLLVVSGVVLAVQAPATHMLQQLLS